MSEKIENLVVLPRRVKPQPTPELHPGGDCGWCCLAGIMNVEVAEAYEHFEHDPKNGLDWYEMRQKLYNGEATGWFDRVIDSVPIWPDSTAGLGQMAYGLGNSPLEWFNYVRMGLDAGYYGIATVDIDRKSEPPNHFVLIVGARDRYEPHATMPQAAHIHNELLISCSARRTQMKDEWVRVHDLLKYRGGYNILMARPAK